MKSCKKCGLLHKDCKCHATKQQATSTNCKTCNTIHNTEYLILGNCHNCHSIGQIEASDREYYRVLAQQFGLPLVDIPLHLQVANKKGMAVEAYLQTLPRNREQFKQYFDSKDINIGGVTL